MKLASPCSLVIVVLTLMLIVSIDASCRYDQPLVTPDFKITCHKYRFLKVAITCLTKQAWHRFPEDKLNLSIIRNTRFINCDFPDDFNVLNITNSLGLELINSLEFQNSQSMLTRAHLKNVTVKTLEIIGYPYSELPKDLLYDINIENFFISEGNIHSVPDDFFKYSANLIHVEIHSCKLKKVRRSDFAMLGNLTSLLLFSNNLEEIEPGAFDNFVNLNVFDISYNNLRTLPSGIFKNMGKLERINLNSNALDELPADLMQIDNSRLMNFRMSFNRGKLRTLPDGFFKNLRSLTGIRMTNNKLTTLSPKVFQNTFSLNELYLFDNEIESLPEGIFEDTNLENLYLEENRLTNLTIGVLSGLQNLKTLNVSHNNINHIDPDICRPHLMNVKTLDLSYNELSLQHVENFPEQFSPLVNCVEITNLNLSHNKIPQIFRDWRNNGNMQNLNLESNSITQLSVREFDWLPQNVEVNLKFNNISSVNLTGLEEWIQYIPEDAPDKIKIDLDGNPLNCDCNAFQLFQFMEKNLNPKVYKFLEFSADELKCVAPSELKNRLRKAVRSEELTCLHKPNVTNDACSNTCLCWEYSGKKLLYVDCSYRNLTSVPAFIGNEYNYAIELNMTGNKLQETPSLNHSYLLKVTVLDLSNNNISTVTPEVFSSALKDLKLHDNSLSRLSFQIIQYLSKETLLRNLTLFGNKWNCDCEAREFLGFIQKKLTILQLHGVTCSDNNRQLWSMTVTELCESVLIIIIVSSVLIALFGLIIGCLAALYYRYQKEIKIWLYSKQWCLWFVTEDELDKDKLYDAFISYSHKDEEFVDTEIVAKLEDGPRPYKLCLHYRDWLAGEWIPAQIARSVEESRRTIVVLSPNFIESVWGRMEFRTAHSQALSEGRARVIVILYGDIGNTDDLDPELKAYLSMNTYVKWGDPWFWDKLKYALPHKYETSKHRTRNARIIENHMSQMPVITHEANGKSEIIPLPKIAPVSNDSAKLLDSNADDDRMIQGIA